MKLEDNICPICLHILVQPVTMPCDHELCLPCFEQNVQEANFCCPCCRCRISSWARKKARTNSLVNEKKWGEIQKHFPAQVKKRLEGDDDDEEINALNISIRLAEPGEIRNEYLQQLEKLQEQRSEERSKELEASEKLIRQLQEEENKRQAQLMALEKEDEELAKQLAEMTSPENEIRTRSNVSVTNDPGTGSTMESFISRLQEDQCETRSPPRSPYPYSCLTPINSGGGKICVDKDKVQQMEDNFLKRKIRKDKNLITTTDIERLELSFSKSRSKLTSSTEIAIPELPQPVVKTSSPSTLTNTMSTASLHQSEILNQMSTDVCINLVDEESNSNSDILLISPSTDTGPELPRSISSHSIDSISQELNHFRPIRSCPLTPPRRLPSGKVVEPKLIRTTPRNLSGSGFTSPVETNLSDIDAGSPVMQRRLSQLADERKDQVERLSKSTSTIGVISPNENLNPEKNVSRQVTFTHVGNRTTELKDISNSPLTTHDLHAGRKLIIPLEPDLENDWMTSSTSFSPLNIERSSPVQLSDSKRNLRYGKLSHSRKGKNPKVRYSSESSQASLMSWIKKGDTVCLNNSRGGGDGIQCNGRDNDDNDDCGTATDTYSPKRSRRNTAMYKNPDFVYGNSHKNEKDSESILHDGSGDLFITGNLRKRKASDSKLTPKKRLKTNNKTSVSKPVSKGVKSGLKKTKSSLKVGKLAKNGCVKHAAKPDRTIHDFFSNLRSGDADVETDDEDLDQEEKDRRMALALQKQFEYEQKYGLNALRMKGTGEEYSLRKPRRNKCLSDV